ncbi:hypothetical protein JCM11251_001083 [Rhodosporidiobolus azoricus]
MLATRLATSTRRTSCFSSPSHRLFSSSRLSLSLSIRSRKYPDLYYHPLDSSSSSASLSYSLSYLPDPPPSLAFSPTTIGLLRPLAQPSAQSTFPGDKQPEIDVEGVPPLTPRSFQENSDFLKLVHTTLREAVEGDLWLQTQAKSMEGTDTYIHIPDHRCPADANRQPSPQDILASLLVQSGKLVPESYEPNKVAYRLVTEDGLMRLPEGLHKAVVQACGRVREIEEEVASGKE